MYTHIYTDTDTHTHMEQSSFSRRPNREMTLRFPSPLSTQGSAGKAQASLSTWPVLKSSGAFLLTKAFGI